MRIAMTLIVFVMVGVTMAGFLLAALLTAPVSTREVWDLFGWVAAGGFALALVASYFIAGRILATGRVDSTKT